MRAPYRVLLCVLATCGFFLSHWSGAEAQRPEPNKLALIIAAPGLDDKTGMLEPFMSNDAALLSQALLGRGFKLKEILVLDGGKVDLDRGKLLAFLQQAAAQVAGWNGGTILLFYSGHGDKEIERRTARASMVLKHKGDVVAWQTVFDALKVPKGVNLLVLPDG